MLKNVVKSFSHDLAQRIFTRIPLKFCFKIYNWFLFFAYTLLGYITWKLFHLIAFNQLIKNFIDFLFFRLFSTNLVIFNSICFNLLFYSFFIDFSLEIQILLISDEDNDNILVSLQRYDFFDLINSFNKGIKGI